MTQADVLIVGAGFAGLAAAHLLRDAGFDAVVLEARDRVGGRVELQVNGLGERIDTGGQFLCQDMPVLMELVRHLGGTLVETPDDGAPMTQPAMTMAELERSYAGSMALRDRLIDTAAEAPGSLTVADWLAARPEAADEKSGFRSMMEGLWCQPLERMPLWYLADNDRRVTNEVTELQYFLRDTMHGLAERFAAPLAGCVHLSSAVSAIAHDGGGVWATAGATEWRARAAIVAVPPFAASHIGVTPELPARLSAALAVWRSGTVVKMLLRYSRAFWHDAGRSGVVMWRDVYGLFACDASRDADHAALVVFVGGPLAATWGSRGEASLRAEVLDRLVAALGPEAGQPLDMLLRDWTEDRWSGGGYSDVIVDPAAIDAEEVLRAGAWPVLFASSELSPSFPGYIEGAIIAGRAAAARCIAALSPDGVAAIDDERRPGHRA